MTFNVAQANGYFNKQAKAVDFGSGKQTNSKTSNPIGENNYFNKHSIDELDKVMQEETEKIFKKLDSAEEKIQKEQKEAKIKEKQSSILEINDAMNTLIGQLSYMDDPCSNEAMSIKKKIEALGEIKVKQIKELAKEYPSNSPEAKALVVGAKQAKLQMEADLLRADRNIIQKAVSELSNQLSYINDPNSGEGQSLQKKIDAVKGIQDSIEKRLSTREKKIDNNNEILQKILPDCDSKIIEILI